METLQTLPLNTLKIDALNVRRVHTPENVEALAANIAACGLINPLTVRKKGKTASVISGGRRFTALKLLAEQKKLKTNHPVPVVIFKGSEAEAIQVSLSENTQRQDMDPADEFVAFSKLYNNGKGRTLEEIAEAYSTSPRRVSAMVKLGELPEPALEGLRDGDLSVNQLKQLANCGSQEIINTVLERIGNGEQWWQVSNLLDDNHVSGDHYLAKFVGLDAYKAAGGTIRADLFSTDEQVIFEDAALLSTLAEQLLAKKAEDLKQEGWLNIKVYDLGDTCDTWKFHTCQPVVGTYSAKDEKLKEKLKANIEANETKLIELDSDDTASDDDYEVLDNAIQNDEHSLEVLEEKYTAFSDDQKATATVHLSLTHYNGVRVHYTLPKSEGQGTTLEKPEMTKAYTERLVDMTTIAAGLSTMKNPKAAKVLLITSLYFDKRSLHKSGPIKLSNDNSLRLTPDMNATLQGVDAYFYNITYILKSVGLDPDQKFEDANDLFSTLIALDDSALDQLLAVCAAQNINFSTFTGGAVAFSDAYKPTAKLLNLSMADRYTVDEAALKSMSVAAIMKALASCNDADAMKLANAAKTKKEKIKVALPVLQQAGWLPDIIKPLD